MKNVSRILSFIMAATLVLCDLGIDAYAVSIGEQAVMDEIQNQTALEKDKDSTTDMLSDAGNEEQKDFLNPTTEEDTGESFDNNENNLSESLSDNNAVNSDLTEEDTETAEEEGGEADAEENEEDTELDLVEEKEESRYSITDVRNFNDILQPEAVYVPWEEVQGQGYDADELIEMAENTPSFLAESYGNTGDNYSSYYIYNRLGEDGKKLWDAMEVLYSEYFLNEADFKDGYTDMVIITVKDLTLEEFKLLIGMFKYSHPQYYYLGMGYRYSMGGNQMGVSYQVYKKFQDGAARKNATEQIFQKVNSLKAEILQCTTEEEKVLKIHNQICDNVDYNYEVLAEDGMITAEEEELHMTQSAYSVFCMEKTVCAGYTKAFSWLCSLADIEVMGVTSSDHAWNKVKINDNWYNEDCTWDDGTNLQRGYSYHLRNDDFFHASSSHREEEFWGKYLPSCTLDSGGSYSVPGTLPQITECAAEPEISVSRNENETAYVITMSSETPGAQIIYTLDGRDPSEANSKGTLYNGTFEINEDTQIKAIAVCDKYLDSEIRKADLSLIEYNIAMGNCGTNIRWKLNSAGQLILEGTGTMANYNSSREVPWYSYTERIKEIVMSENITSIGNYAFSALPNLQKFQFPAGVSTVGERAFYQSGLMEVQIPSTVNHLGSYAFASCAKLEKVTILDNFESMGICIFSMCTKLKNVTLPENFHTIGGYMFYYCYSLKQIQIPKEVTSIQEYAFAYCMDLMEIEIPDKVDSIGERAFYICSSLTQIALPRGITSIGKEAIAPSVLIKGYGNTAAQVYADANGNEFYDLGITRYTVRLVLDNEEISKTIYGEGALVSEPKLETKRGCRLEGWYTSLETQDDTTKWNFAKDTVNKDMTLYARWIQKYTAAVPVADALDGSILTVGAEVRLTTVTHGAKIYYTTNDRIGAAVNEENGTLYQGPLTITQPVTLYAVTVKEGYKNSQVMTASYQVLEKSQDWGEICEEDRTRFESAEEVPQEIWTAGLSDAWYTGQAVIQSGLRVYYHKTLLVPEVDYTLSYKNNINAATFDVKKAPTVTIKMKGEYTGKRILHFTIHPKNLTDMGYQQVLMYEKQIKLKAPVLYEKEQKLKEGKDFLCDYSQLPSDYLNGDAYTVGKSYTYEVKGIGNFTGSFPMELVVLKEKEKNLGNAQVSLTKYTYEYAGTPLTTEDVEIAWVKINGQELIPSYYTYTVWAEDTGSGYVRIEPSEEGKNAGYRGRKEVKITLKADRNVKDTVLGEGWKEKVTFSKKTLKEQGGFYQAETNLLVYDDGKGLREPLVQGQDYTIQYENAEKAGRVTVTFRGKGRYTGTLKKTYTVLPDNALTVQWFHTDENNAPVAEYQKEGAIPEFRLMDADGQVLKYKTDYSYRAKNNQQLGFMTLEIIGKGNYDGYFLRQQAEVIPADIGNAVVIAKDQKFGKNWKAPIKVRDVNGRLLKAGKDYEENVVYMFAGMQSAKAEEIPAVGSLIRVIVKGKNNYAGTEAVGSYHICARDLQELEIVIDDQTYTGEAVELQKEDIHVYASKADKKAGKEITEECYKITGYHRNTQTGLASVTLEGVGIYGGSRICYFRISQKPFLQTEEIPVSYFELNLPVIEDEAGTVYQLETTKVQPENANVFEKEWKSSDSRIASVDDDGFLILKQPGVAVITASYKNCESKRTCVVWVKETGNLSGKNYVTPQECREPGDTDDTASFQRAITKMQEKGYDTVYVPDGFYQINTNAGIQLENNMNFVLSSGAVLQALSNNTGNEILTVNQASNVVITGGKLISDSNTGSGKGIGIYDSQNVIISEVTISGNFDYGIYVGTEGDGGQTAYEPCRNIAITNTLFTDNTKVGMGIVTAADNVVLSGCTVQGDFINYMGTNIVLDNTTVRGKAYARIGITMKNGSSINGGSEKADQLIASFDAGRDNVTVGLYNTDSGNTVHAAYVRNEAAPLGKALRIECTSNGNKQAGCYLNLSDLLLESGTKLEAGSIYRFEYDVIGWGQWGMKTDQTTWYPCVPQKNQFTTGMTYYEAKNTDSPCRLIFFAERMINGMNLEIASVRIYKVN